jgi:hypothetical protein
MTVLYDCVVCVQLCDTYPRFLFVPSTAPTPIILSSARFRSRGRLPVLSYLHRENQVYGWDSSVNSFGDLCEQISVEI